MDSCEGGEQRGCRAVLDVSQKVEREVHLLRPHGLHAIRPPREQDAEPLSHVFRQVNREEEALRHGKARGRWNGLGTVTDFRDVSMRVLYWHADDRNLRHHAS